VPSHGSPDTFAGPINASTIETLIDAGSAGWLGGNCPLPQATHPVHPTRVNKRHADMVDSLPRFVLPLFGGQATA
jgi:hypothetical protein